MRTIHEARTTQFQADHPLRVVSLHPSRQSLKSQTQRYDTSRGHHLNNTVSADQESPAPAAVAVHTATVSSRAADDLFRTDTAAVRRPACSAVGPAARPASAQRPARHGVSVAHSAASVHRTAIVSTRGRHLSALDPGAAQRKRLHRPSLRRVTTATPY